MLERQDQKCNEHIRLSATMDRIELKLDGLKEELVGDGRTPGIHETIRAHSSALVDGKHKMDCLEQWQDRYTPHLDSLIETKREIRAGFLSNVGKLLPWGFIMVGLAWLHFSGKI